MRSTVHTLRTTLRGTDLRDSRFAFDILTGPIDGIVTLAVEDADPIDARVPAHLPARGQQNSAVVRFRRNRAVVEAWV